MSTDFRALCRELTDVLAELPFGTCEELVVRARAALAADGPAVPEGREPASVVGEPSDQELLQLALDTRLYRFQATAGDPVQYELTEAQINAFARAVLARWGHQPAPPAEGAPGPSMEDVGPLISWLTEQACQAADASQSTDAGMLTWAAQVIGERVNEDAPDPPAEGEAAELVAWLRGNALTVRKSNGNPANEARQRMKRAADLLAHSDLLAQRPEPVPVSERPWEREGWCDEQGWCWFCNSYSMGRWSYSLPPSPGQDWGRLGTMTHSLPHWAIPRPRPLPQQETTNG